MMDLHYNAFISYRHAPADTAVAADIQKRLERYRIPVPIRRKTGIQKIERIFRDKEELPITSDLNESIAQALDNSDFLIVICSEKMKESYWVPREIDYFLKNHSKNRVLTVLVDGEPQDVIPEILKKDVHVRTNADGTEEEIVIEREPLSCDYRPGIRRARKTEIPRLAAALLGCSYDELVMRERHYKTRRLAAVLGMTSVLMLTAIGYLLWSRNEIRRNYDRAEENLRRTLINQSVYLSSESRRLLEEGDRLRAIQLAVEALPGDGEENERNERPLVPEAKGALSRALQAYYTQSGRPSYAATAELCTDGSIQDYFLSRDNSYVCAMDGYARVYVWDVETGQLLLHLHQEDWKHDETQDAAASGEEAFPGEGAEVIVDQEIKQVRELGSDSIAVLTNEGVRAYQVHGGRLLWSFEDDAVRWYSCGICADPDGARLFIGGLEKEWGEDARLDTYPVCLVLDAVSGKETDRLRSDNKDSGMSYVTDCAVSEKGRSLAVSADGSDWNKNLVISFDLQERSSAVMEQAESLVLDLFYPDEDHLCVMSCTDATLLKNIKFGKTYKLSNQENMQVSMFSAEDGKCLWTGDYVTQGVDSGRSGTKFRRVEVAGPDGKKQGFVVSCHADKVCVFREDSGKKFDEISTDGRVVNLGRTLTGSLLLFMEDGYIGSYRFTGDGEVYYISYLSFENQGFEHILSENGRTWGYLIQRDEKTLWICEEVHDEAFTPFRAEGLPPAETGDGSKDYRYRQISRAEITGNTLMLFDGEETAWLYDLEDRNPAIRIDLGEEKAETGSIQYLGKDGDREELWFLEGTLGMSGARFLRVSARDGKVTSFDDPSDKYMMYGSSLSPDRIFWNGKIYIMEDGEVDVLAVQGDKLVIECTLSLGTTEENRADSADGFIVCPNGDLAVFTVGDDTTGRRIYMLDLQTGDRTELPVRMRDRLDAAIVNDTGRFLAVSDGKRVCVCDLAQETHYIKEMTGHYVRSMFLSGDTLAVLYNEGKLLRYDLHSGDFLAVTDLTYSEAEDRAYHETELVDCGDEILICPAGGEQDLIHFLDRETWKETGVVQYPISYDAARDRIICYMDDSSQTERKRIIGYYPRYTAADLLKKAKEVLAGRELSQEDKVRYGID